MNETILKMCSSCSKQYPSTEFRKQGLICKPCNAMKQREWRKKNHEHWRQWRKAHYDKNGRFFRSKRLKTIHGITLAQYEILLEAQNGRCAICKTDKPNGKDNVFVVDHDHSNGRIRGLLCSFCNSGIGYLREKKENFMNAIKYLGIL